MSKKIGIIGFGFVGSAVRFGFSPNTGFDAEIKIFDKDKNKSTHSLKAVVNDSDFIFVSVPTPSDEDGKINLDVVDNLLNDINDVQKKRNIILLRSTMIPGSSQNFQKKYPKLNLVFNPEFLTERSAKLDFINQSRIILGGKARHTSKVAELYKLRFGKTIPIIETNFETAELIKYMNNCFFATKVSFMNEMKILADKCNADWELAVEGFVRDGRVGHSHINVPGHDGKNGFGGSCFPKDIQAIIKYGNSMGVEMNTLIGAWKTNLFVRPEKDWEKLKGRAITSDNEKLN